MVKLEQSEDIDTWQKARALSKVVYAVPGDGAFTRDFDGVALTSETRFALLNTDKKGLCEGIPTCSLTKFSKGTTTWSCHYVMTYRGRGRQRVNDSRFYC